MRQTSLKGFFKPNDDSKNSSQSSGGSSGSPSSQLTPEQAAKIEESRARALARRAQKQSGTQPATQTTQQSQQASTAPPPPSFDRFTFSPPRGGGAASSTTTQPGSPSPTLSDMSSPPLFPPKPQFNAPAPSSIPPAGQPPPTTAKQDAPSPYSPEKFDSEFGMDILDVDEEEWVPSFKSKETKPEKAQEANPVTDSPTAFGSKKRDRSQISSPPAPAPRGITKSQPSGSAPAPIKSEDQPAPKRAKTSAAASAAPVGSPLKSGKKKAASGRAATTSDSVDNESGESAQQAPGEMPHWVLYPKDAEGRPVDHPEYDPCTLYIPPSAQAAFSNFERQFWDIKKKHFDCVVFFKKGKFYELYGPDADVGISKLFLTLTKSERANSLRMTGVPETSFEQHAHRLLQFGHKVAKVDETNEKDGTIVKRQLTKIYTPGTITDAKMCLNQNSTYILAVKESESSEGGPVSYGLCFVDCSTAQVILGEMTDDAQRTRFETTLLQYKPKEVVFEKGTLSQVTNQILKRNIAPSSLISCSPADFWDRETVLDRLRMDLDIFPAATGVSPTVRGGGGGGASSSSSSTDSWPQVLRDFADNELVMGAFGGAFAYLRSLCIDREVLPQKNFRLFDAKADSEHLILDGQTLTNLEILQNQSDGTEQGTLIELLNHCVTPFGKRLFRTWVCHPLRDAEKINARLDAIEDFKQLPCDAFSEIPMVKMMKDLPDLERLVARLHYNAQSKSSAQVVMVGSTTVSEWRQIKACLDGLHTCQAIREQLVECASAGDVTSARLQALASEEFPDLTDLLDEINEMYTDTSAPKASGSSGKKGKDADLTLPLPNDSNARWKHFVQKEQEELEGLNEQLRLWKSTLRCNEITWGSAAKLADQYVLQVPTAVARKCNHRDLIHVKDLKSVSRFTTAEIQRQVLELESTREQKEEIIKGLMTDIMTKFNENYDTWKQAIDCISQLDCLHSLFRASTQSEVPMCRPVFRPNDLYRPRDTEGLPRDAFQTSYLELRQMQHPCASRFKSLSTGRFVPNDTVLGGSENATSILLTGPNMGGKSTLLRQTCLAVIMAQMGCYVPAQKCELHIVDQIFTRIGAQDRIMIGQSTFMVETQETANILHQATADSLVILDELGRGTSTFDGFSVAYAVLKQLATKTRCRTLFSTHYHMLNEDMADEPDVGLFHMGFRMDPESQQPIFLYKLTPGECDKSFGLTVAKMAGLSDEVVASASKVSARYEETSAATKVNRAKLQKPIGLQKSAIAAQIFACAKSILPATAGGSSSTPSSQENAMFLRLKELQEELKKFNRDQEKK